MIHLVIYNFKQVAIGVFALAGTALALKALSLIFQAEAMANQMGVF